MKGPVFPGLFHSSPKGEGKAKFPFVSVALSPKVQMQSALRVADTGQDRAK